MTDWAVAFGGPAFAGRVKSGDAIPARFHHRVGPILALTVFCFFLAFVAEFAIAGETLSESAPEDESAQQI